MFTIYADGKPIYVPGNPQYALLRPSLTLEVGKAGSLTFDYLPDQELDGRLKKLKTSISVESDGFELFRGRILDKNGSFYNVKTVYCEGDLSYLVDSVQKPEAYHGTTRALFSKVIESHNARADPEKRFKIGEVTIDDVEITLSGKQDEPGGDHRQMALNAIVEDWKKTLDYIQSCLIDNVGGYLRTRREKDGVYIDLLKEYGGDAEQEIRFGVNLLDLTQEVSAEELFTVLVPLGDDNLTVASVNHGSDELVDEEAVAQYGRIVRTHVFNDVNKPETLMKNARRYMKENIHVPTTFTIRAVDLHATQPDIPEIRIGDRVRLCSAPHGIQDRYMCTRIAYNLSDASKTEYTFGNPKQTLTQRYRTDARKQRDEAVEHASRGGGGAGKKAEEDAVKEAMDSVYREWIDYDPDNPDAKMSLGALSVLTNEMKEVLHTEVGINFDGVGGNLNLYAIQKNIDENKATDDQRYADLDLRANQNEAAATLNAQYIATVEGELVKNVASITARADKQGSEIAANADQISLNARKIVNINGEIVNINSEITNVKQLVADSIDAVRADIEAAIAEVVTTRYLNVTASANFVSGSIHYGGSTVKMTPIPVVTSFTQASGETAPTRDVTFLHTAIGNPVVHQPELGGTMTF